MEEREKRARCSAVQQQKKKVIVRIQVLRTKSRLKKSFSTLHIAKHFKVGQGRIWRFSVREGLDRKIHTQHKEKRTSKVWEKKDKEMNSLSQNTQGIKYNGCMELGTHVIMRQPFKQRKEATVTVVELENTRWTEEATHLPHEYSKAPNITAKKEFDREKTKKQRREKHRERTKMKKDEMGNNTVRKIEKING